MANPNLKQEPVNPDQVVSSIMKLFDPISNNMQDTFKASEALRPIDPETFQSIQAGNLANAESLASSNLWAMTPEMFKMAMEQRPDLMKQAGQVTSLSDALLGRSATRAGREKLAIEEARMGQQAVEGGLRRVGDIEGRNLKKTELAQRDEQFNREMAFRESDAKERRDIDRARLDLESRRQKFIEGAAAGQAIEGTAPDPSMMSRFDSILTQLGAVNPKKAGTFDLDEVKPGYKKIAIATYMQREAAKGLPFYQPYDIPESQQPFLDGFKQIILGPKGWHGIYKGKDNKAHVTTDPVIPYRQAAKGKGTAGAAGMVDVYRPE